MFDWLTIENYEQIESYYRTLGPVMGLLLPFLEAFLPFLPLFVIVVANTNAFGVFGGFIISWLGSAAGSYMVFTVVRLFGKHPRFHIFTQKEQVQKLIRWVDMRGLSPLFVLLCFPFTPSFLVNIVAGLSNIRKKYYLIVVFMAKLVMITFMSFIGHDIVALVTSPLKLALAVLATIALWFIGKAVEKRLNRRVENDLRTIQQHRINK